METAVVFDCEFLVVEGAQRRFWCGPYDPDPVIAQIGAVKLGLDENFPILDRLRVFVKPVDRHGRDYEIDSLFEKLTGITPELIARKGVPLKQAIDNLNSFSRQSQFWSWGKDELNMMAISCYVAGIDPVIPANRFDNACKLLLKAGMPYEDIKKTRSPELADYYGIKHPHLRGHDALDDALSVAYVLQHLLTLGRLSREHFQST